MKSNRRLQTRLVLLVVAAVMPLSALSIWSAVREARSATRLVQTQLKLAASLLATSQDATVESARQMLGAVTTLPDIRTLDQARCDQYFKSLRERYPIYANIGFLDLQGKVVCHANFAEGSFSAGDRSYFAKTVASRSFVVGEVALGRIARRPIIPFAMPILQDGNVTGVAFATLDLTQASAALARIRVPDGARVVVADRRGVVLMEHPAREEPGNRKLTNPVLVQAAAALGSGVGEGRDTKGDLRIFAYDAGRAVDGEGFLTIVGMSEHEVAAASQASLRDELCILLVTLLLGMIAAWWLGRRAIVAPAAAIMGVVQALEKGNLDARAEVDAKARGEFARIGAAFNEMAGALQLRQQDLEAGLERSRNANAVLDLVLNSMQEGLIACNSRGEFLMYNLAASHIFDMDGAHLAAQEWPRHFGLFHVDGSGLFDIEELPLARALAGESGTMEVFVRNKLAPQGRLLYCTFRPMRDGDRIRGGLVVFNDVTQLQQLQAEQASQFRELRNAQRRLLEAQRIGRVGNWELDQRTGRLWWSREVYELFGANEGNFDGTLEAFARFVHPDDRAGLELARRTALEGGVIMRTDYRIVRPDGSIAWMHEMGEVVLRGADGAALLFAGVVQDITDRKMAEQALRASQRELQDYTHMLQRAANGAKELASLQNVDDVLTGLAAQARTVIGCASAVAVLLPPEGGTPAAPLRDGVLLVPLLDRRGKGIGVLELSEKPDGDFTERDEYVAVEMAQLAAIAVDNARLIDDVRELNAGLETRIAERTAELSRQEALFRALAEQAPEVIWTMDAKGEKVTFLNRAWYELIGGTPSQWIGRSGLASIHPDDRADVVASWLRSRETLSTFTGIRRLRAHDGRYHTMSYKAVPVLNEKGEMAFWVGIDSDITQLKAIEHALRSSNQELEAFSYSVSHDLRAPLSAIGGFSRALALRLDLGADDRAAHFLARIQAGAAKMEELIEAMLSLSKVVRAPLVMQPVDLSALARETMEGLQVQQAERGVRAIVQPGLQAQGDSRLLRLVIENLVGNAWKFTAGRDEAVIEVGQVSGSGAFFVRDNGVGFDMAYAGKLFGAFQRLHTEAEFPGTGIGLATVRRIVVRHHGRVWVESQPGEGTTFFFTLQESD